MLAVTLDCVVLAFAATTIQSGKRGPS